MPDLLLSSIEYSGYISLTKLIIFLVLFFLWLPIVSWVYQDARAVGTKDVFWTAVVLGAGAAAAIIWLLVPMFIIGLLFYLIAVGAASASYVMHRNAIVPDFDRVLTAEHIKGLFTNEQKKVDALKNLVFITANNNEAPVPEPKTTDFFGYKAAYDIITDAKWRRAAVISFSPTHQDYEVTYHVDGSVLKQPTISRDRMDYFIRFAKHLAALDPDEKRKPQKGKFLTFQNKERTDWELTTAGSTTGEQVRLKQITKQAIKKLSEIGLESEQFEQLNAIRQTKQGVFIISGPKQSGVTTTFYALLKNHDAFLNNVVTIETRPSAELPNITQNIFSLSDTGTTTYAKKLQMMVRMEPDIVGVADCQEAEAAHIACVAAREKIVYVTLEEDSVIKALGKWIKLVGDRNLSAGTLLGISNQRLLRKLCDQCKQAYEPNKELIRKFNLPAEKVKTLYRAGKVLYDKHGKPSTCQNCQGTGFVGRICIFEVISIDDHLREIIKQSKSLSELDTQFRLAKMLHLQDLVLQKVIDGTTAINEMVRALSADRTEAPGQKTQTPEGSEDIS